MAHVLAWAGATHAEALACALGQGREACARAASSAAGRAARCAWSPLGGEDLGRATAEQPPDRDELDAGRLPLVDQALGLFLGQPAVTKAEALVERMGRVAVDD